jgi:hypothetical protein
MKTLFYSSRDDPNTKRLEGAVRQVIPESHLEFFHDLHRLEERLRKPIEPDSIAVLSVLNKDELKKMQSLRRLLPEIYVVLVIPDQRKSTLALAHLLLPRFLSPQDGDYENLKFVLQKMYINSQHPLSGELTSEA